MKKVILFLNIILLASCLPTTKKQIKKEALKNNVTLLADDFLKRHKNYFNNDVTISKSDKLFRKEFLDSIRLKGSGEILLELKGIKKVGKEYYSHFSAEGIVVSRYRMYFDILTKINEKAIDTLKQKQKYKVIFTPHSFATKSIRQSLSDKMYYTPFVGIEKADFGGGLKINLGIMTGDLNNIKNIN